MANNIQYSNAFGGVTLSTTEQSDGSHALNVVMAQMPMRDLSVYSAQPVAGSTNLSILGGAISSGTGTISTAIAPSATDYTRFRRSRNTGSASAGNVACQQTSYTRWFRGATGGFDAFIQFGIGNDVTGYQGFVGFSTLTAGLAAEPSTLTDCFGIGFDSTDAAGSTWFVYQNNASGSCTRTAITGMTRSATAGYNLRIVCPAGASSDITLTITNAHSGAAIYSATFTGSELPTANTALSFGANHRNGAIASSAILDVSKIYIACAY